MITTIRKYRADDEQNWVRCRVLSMLDTTQYDDVMTAKPVYPNPAVQIVAECGGKIVGLIDIEYDTEERRISYDQNTPGGIIRTIAVLPEYRRERVAEHLLKYACELLGEEGIGHLEAWARKEDDAVCHFLIFSGFRSGYSYLHFYAEGSGCRSFAPCRMLDCFVMRVYGEYTGEDRDAIRRSAGRCYECVLFERDI